jgi:hypothetical protein
MYNKRTCTAGPRQFIEKLRDGTVIDPRNLLKILPLLFEQAIAFIFSELDYERNLKCNTAIAVRLLAIYSARKGLASPAWLQAIVKRTESDPPSPRKCD